MQLILLFVLCFVAADASSETRDRQVFPHDMTSEAELNKLYASPVVTAEKVSRPFRRFRWFRHSGVRVTTDTGDSWLIHKGNGYGLSSQTVAVHAVHMSNQWTGKGPVPVTDRTLGDYVRDGGPTYNLITDNCYHASDRMMPNNSE